MKLRQQWLQPLETNPASLHSWFVHQKVLASGGKQTNSVENSQITSEVFVKPVTASQLDEVAASTRETLCNLGYKVTMRHHLSDSGPSTAAKPAYL